MAPTGEPALSGQEALRPKARQDLDPTPVLPCGESVEQGMGCQISCPMRASSMESARAALLRSRISWQQSTTLWSAGASVARHRFGASQAGGLWIPRSVRPN
jgi:hypothetical protein